LHGHGSAALGFKLGVNIQSARTPCCLNRKQFLSIWLPLLWPMESVKSGYANATNLLVQPFCV
jgi:hypothetical protein